MDLGKLGDEWVNRKKSRSNSVETRSDAPFDDATVVQTQASIENTDLPNNPLVIDNVDMSFEDGSLPKLTERQATVAARLNEIFNGEEGELIIDVGDGTQKRVQLHNFLKHSASHRYGLVTKHSNKLYIPNGEGANKFLVEKMKDGVELLGSVEETERAIAKMLEQYDGPQSKMRMETLVSPGM